MTDPLASLRAIAESTDESTALRNLVDSIMPLIFEHIENKPETSIAEVVEELASLHISMLMNFFRYYHHYLDEAKLELALKHSLLTFTAGAAYIHEHGPAILRGEIPPESN